MLRCDIINELILKNNYKTYLEIGLSKPDDNYNYIVCESKECVDPYEELPFEDYENSSILFQYIIDNILTYRMTSDDFFAQNKKTYDLIFIDGLHTKEQVAKDIINALKILNPGGKIVVHDCCPPSEEAQIVPRIQEEWTGDVWKTIPQLKKQGISFNTVYTDYGVCIIDYFENAHLLEHIDNWEHDWNDYICNGMNLLNIITENDFRNKYIKHIYAKNKQ
jgi:SAM-dependent methyltransferase